MLALLALFPALASELSAEPRRLAPDTEKRSSGVLVGTAGDRALEGDAGRTDPAGRPQGLPATHLAFVDVTGATLPGLAQGLYFGCTWIDLDDDGDLDLTLPMDNNGGDTLRVLRNDGSQFVDITSSLGLNGLERTRSISWVDIDGDGDLDLFATRRSSAAANLLFENQGGVMMQRTGVPELLEPANDVTSSWADYDGDGDLDCFLPGTVLFGIRLLRNDGGFAFTDVTTDVGLPAGFSGLAGAWGDMDDDGDPDLAIGGTDDFLLFRNQNGQFDNFTGNIGSGSALLAVPSWADADNDGDLDLLIGGLNPPQIWENLTPDNPSGLPLFRNATGDWGSGFPVSLGSTWADLDLDGDLDLLDEGGFNGVRVYENRIESGFGFVDVTFQSGVNLPSGVSWHPVPGDFDGDGLVDFFAPHDSLPRLYRNVSSTSDKALRIRLKTASGQVPAGVRVLHSRDERLQMREVGWPGAGFAFGSPTITMALQKKGAAPWVEVRWGPGRWERYFGLPAVATHTLVEGEGKSIDDPYDDRWLRRRGNEPPLSIMLTSCNPCREEISFTSRKPGEFEQRIGVYDLRGRLLRELRMSGGSASWDLRDRDGRRVSPGVYFARERGATTQKVTRFVVLP